MYEEERKNGVLDVDTKTPSGINRYEPGYLDKDLEEIVGFQTDKPLKRAIMPNGGIRIVEKSCESYGYKVDEEVEYIYHNLRKLIMMVFLKFIHQIFVLQEVTIY